MDDDPLAQFRGKGDGTKLMPADVLRALTRPAGEPLSVLVKSELAVALDKHYRGVILESTDIFTKDPQEQLEVLTGTITLLVRRGYQLYGPDWIEGVILAAMKE